jgi:hypothetical protein
MLAITGEATFLHCAFYPANLLISPLPGLLAFNYKYLVSPTGDDVIQSA